MTQAPASSDVPQWTIGDRLGKALGHAQIGVGDMATYLGLSRNSISAYVNDRAEPKRQTLLLWAMRTGVSLEWLESGEAVGSPFDPGPQGQPAPDSTQLERLAEQKRARTRGPRSTHRYLPAFASPAAFLPAAA